MYTPLKIFPYTDKFLCKTLVSGYLVIQYLRIFCVFILIYYLLWCSSLILLSGDIKTNPGLISSSGNCFSIFHWNLNSITAHNYAKLSLLTAYNLVDSFDMICLSETYLNSETPPNYQVIICSTLITLPILKEEVFVFITNRPFL